MKGLPNVREGADIDEVLEEVVAARKAGNDPKELFGGPRDWVDAMAPTVVFVFANVVSDLRTAVYLAVATAVVAAVVRAVRRESLRHAFSGVLGVAIAAGFALWTKDKDNFFLPGIITNALYGSAFLLSVLLRHPLVGVIMRVIWNDRPKEWHQHPVVRRAYTEMTLLWSGMFFLRFVVQELLRRNDQTALLGAAKLAGMPLYFALLAITLPYVKRRSRTVPLPEPITVSAAEAEAEAGGEDAGDDAPEPVGDRPGA